MKPRIAIPLPTTGDLAYNKLNWPAYADAVLASGGDPVRFSLELSRREALALAATCQGILLPGSPADVNPARYGQVREDATAEADPLREILDELLMENGLGSGKPLLAICFGAQILNVWRGGTLVQDLTVFPVNHPAGRAVAVAHTVAIAAGTMLSSLVDPTEGRVVDGFVRLPVNSSHHQAAGVAGRGLRVSARCPQDGVAEAVEFEAAGDRFVLGVQWHPERTFDSSPTSRAIFSRFIGEAAVWHSAEVTAVTA